MINGYSWNKTGKIYDDILSNFTCQVLNSEDTLYWQCDENNGAIFLSWCPGQTHLNQQTDTCVISCLVTEWLKSDFCCCKMDLLKLQKCLILESFVAFYINKSFATDCLLTPSIPTVTSKYYFSFYINMGKMLLCFYLKCSLTLFLREAR